MRPTWRDCACLDLLRWGVAVSPGPASMSPPGGSSSTRAVSFLRPCRPSQAPRLRGATLRTEGGRSSAALAGHRQPSTVSWPAEAIWPGLFGLADNRFERSWSSWDTLSFNLLSRTYQARLSVLREPVRHGLRPRAELRRMGQPTLVARRTVPGRPRGLRQLCHVIPEAL